MASKVKTVERTKNSVIISWKHILPRSRKYVLQIETFCKEWRTLYCGPKQEFLIDDLEPCSYYNFRLKGDLFDWIHFKNGTDLNFPYVNQMSNAVEFSKTLAIRKIIQAKPILLDTENVYGKTPLVQAIESSNLQMVAFLINLGASVNLSSIITKRSPLMVALCSSSIQISNLLLDKGAVVDLRDCNGLTALHYAVDSNRIENVRLGLAQKIDINVKDNQGWTPLLRAIILNCSDELIKFLLDNGADVNVQDKYGFDVNMHLELNKRVVHELVNTKLNQSDMNSQ